MSIHDTTTASIASLDYPSFKRAMVNATKVIEKSGTIPITRQCAIRCKAGSISVSGTDLDLFTTTSVQGAADDGFVAIVDAHKLKGLMDKVKDVAWINFARTGQKLTATIGKLNVTMAVEHSEKDYAETDGAFRQSLKESPHSFILKSAMLAKMLQKVSMAISTEETRYYLNGIYMHFSEHAGNLVFVSTDGNRLVRYEVDAPSGVAEMPGVIIPRKTAAELNRLVKAKGCPEDVMVTVTSTGVSFLIGDDELIESKVIDGTFPDYTRVIPTNNIHLVIATPSQVIEAIKQVSSIKSARDKQIKLNLMEDVLSLSCSDNDFGTASLDVPVSNHDTLEIGFNAGFLTDILSNIDGQAIIRFASPGDPCRFEDSEDPAVTFVLMPMRV